MWEELRTIPISGVPAVATQQHCSHGLRACFFVCPSAIHDPRDQSTIAQKDVGKLA